MCDVVGVEVVVKGLFDVYVVLFGDLEGEVRIFVVGKILEFCLFVGVVYFVEKILLKVYELVNDLF